MAIKLFDGGVSTESLNYNIYPWVLCCNGIKIESKQELLCCLKLISLHLSLYQTQGVIVPASDGVFITFQRVGEDVGVVLFTIAPFAFSLNRTMSGVTHQHVLFFLLNECHFWTAHYDCTIILRFLIRSCLIGLPFLPRPVGRSYVYRLYTRKSAIRVI